jgi:hypothetical protein
MLTYFAKHAAKLTVPMLAVNYDHSVDRIVDAAR